MRSRKTTVPFLCRNSEQCVMFGKSALWQRKTWKTATIYCPIVVIVLSVAPWGEFARAQTVIGCGVDNLTRATLESVKTASEEARISAARALIENWQVSL